MSRLLTLEEVKTYADALILQYIEKKRISEVSEFALLKIRSDEEKEISGGLLRTLVGKEHKFDTVLENIIYQHLARAFDDVDVSSPDMTIQRDTSDPLHKPKRLLSGRHTSLHDVSKNATLTRRSTVERPITVSNNTGHKTPTQPKVELKSIERTKSCKTTPFTRKKSLSRRDNRPQTAPAGVFTITTSHYSSWNGKFRSRENWIPDQIREKMVQRDLSVAKRNLEFNNMYQQFPSFRTTESGNEQGTNGMTTFERSLTKEKFGLATRKQCGLCCRLFLPVNLIMAVPFKAVFDIRDTWGDKFDPHRQKSGTVTVNSNLKRAPACYDCTRVCAFCSQLFDNQQEIYRPSFESKEAERERANEVERERTIEVMSDPLKRVDDERVNEILRDAEMQRKTI